MNRKIEILLFVVVFLVAVFLRFYQLGNVPFGFYQDESAIGYNAYCVIHTGKDEWGASLPLYFKSFGDYKLPVYIYATIPSILLFGMNEFAVRFPSALFGSLTIGAAYFLTKKLTQNAILSLMTMAFLALNPWSLHYNRATFEVSISLFLFVVGAFFLLESSSSKGKGFFFLGTLCFILSLYSYNLTRLLSPILYTLVLFYIFWQKKFFSKKEVILTTFFSIVLLAPFISTFFSAAGVSSASGTLLFSSAVVKAPLVEFRSYLAAFPFGFGKFFAMPVLLAWQYITNIALYFSVTFLFLTGSTHGNHGIGNVGQFYLFEFPIMIAGVVFLIKEKQKWGVFLFGWAIITILVASLTRDVPHATRSFFLVFPYEIFSAYGLCKLIAHLYAKPKVIKIGGLGIIILFISFNLLYYFTSYYIRFPILYAKDWRLEDKAVSEFIHENDQKYDKIIFDKKAGFIYTSLLFFNQFPPSEFQSTEKREKPDAEGFSMVSSFGKLEKYQFKDVNWVDDFHKGDLIITTPDQVPANVLPIKSFVYPTRPVAFALNQEVISYPVDEVAYVAVEGR